jgi:nitrite reductase/ring-hydroxylating ferredoxin subunit
MEALMTEVFVPAIKTADVPANGMVVVDVKGTRIAVANVQGVFYAFDDECTHEQCSLAEGDLAGTTLTCMCHGAEFDVRSGAVLAPPAIVPIRVYRTRVEGDALHIEI